MLIKAILVSLVVWLGFLDKAFIHSFIYRPICIGPLVGFIMGNLQIGLQVGVAVELMFLAVVLRFRRMRCSVLPLRLHLHVLQAVQN